MSAHESAAELSAVTAPCATAANAATCDMADARPAPGSHAHIELATRHLAEELLKIRELVCMRVREEVLPMLAAVERKLRAYVTATAQEAAVLEERIASVQSMLSWVKSIVG